MAEYDPWAPWYDLVHDGLPGEAEFYVGNAVRIGGLTLELGCGTGRIALPVAMSGGRVTALDNAWEMLRVLRHKQACLTPMPGVVYAVCADMRRFCLGARYNLVLIPYRTFMHLLSPEDRTRCLQCVRQHLAPGGRLIMNCWNPGKAFFLRTEAASSEMQPAETRPLPEAGEELAIQHRWEWDGARRILREEYLLRHMDSHGRVLESRLLPLTRAVMTPGEIEETLRANGFALEALHGDFDCAPLREDSPESVWVARAG